MGYQVERLRTGDGRVLVGAGELRERIDRLMRVDGERFRRLWAYYRNPMRAVSVEGSEAGCARPYRQAQEWGMPTRITGFRAGVEPLADGSVNPSARKEVVIENDIAWRVDTMVDYLFGRPLGITSAAPDEVRREEIGRLLRMILAHNGGIGFLQQLALIGAVYGFVDVVVKVVECEDGPRAPAACDTGSLGERPADERNEASGAWEGAPGAGAAAEGSAPGAGDVGASAGDDGQGGRDPGAHSATDALLQRVAQIGRAHV